MKQKKTRNSSIEALKLIGICSIVVSHVVYTLEKGSPFVSDNGYVIDLTRATDNIQYLIASMLRYGGEFGNTIFFICSAWFLLGRVKGVDKKKVLYMFADVWTISVLILVVVLVRNGGRLHRTLILQSLFPTTSENNWYITCYLIFYIIHPVLNKAIAGLKQRTLLRLNILAIWLYLIIAFACRASMHAYGIGTQFFSSRLVMWTVVYFMLAYVKFYANDFFSRRSVNTGLIAFGFIGNCGLIILTNILGLKFGRFSDALQIWIVQYNLFLIISAIGLHGIARNISFENKAINYVSKLSLFIYIIHENRLLRTLYRPLMLQYVYARFGYEHLIFWIIVLAAIVFVFALICSIVYAETIHKLTMRVCDWVYPYLAAVWMKFETKVIGSSSET